MQDKWDAGQVGCTIMQDKQNTGYVGCRICGMQDKWNTGEVICWTGGIQSCRISKISVVDPDLHGSSKK